MDFGEQPWETASSWQGADGAADHDRNNRDTAFKGERRKSGFEVADFSVWGPGAFRENKQITAFPQGMGHHVERQLHVATHFDDDDVAVACEPFEQAVGDMLSLGVVIGVAEDAVWQEHRNEKAVDVGLMVCDQYAGPRCGQVVAPVDAGPEKDPQKKAEKMLEEWVNPMGSGQSVWIETRIGFQKRIPVAGGFPEKYAICICVPREFKNGWAILENGFGQMNAE